MEVEHQLHSTYGNKRPFTVPDHYFSDLSSQIMANIPVEEPVKTSDNTVKTKKSHFVLIRRVRPLAIAAAMIGIVMIAFWSFADYTSNQKSAADAPEKGVGGALSKATSSDSFDEAADYIMMDEDDMYAYVADQ
ncbi:MAG: hypothetical protein HXN33_10385 [Prevotella histicola]|jgi:hypothetical protein|uniref:Uncharacterized protein n=1 Tax=Prevotella histicola TaxID=470565 RepID=A0A930HZS6_9BACT|nr:hypothetical protein [Prevotella histicola]